LQFYWRKVGGKEFGKKCGTIVAMTNRFFVDRSVSRWDTDEVLLSGDEAHHFCKVMRGKVGDPLVLFDGTRRYAHGVVEAMLKEGVRIRITDTFADEVESPLRLTVAAALPKGDRQRFLIEKLAELGTARFVPVQMERSVARANDAVIQRLRRYVIEAAKQCGRNVLMEITHEVPMSRLSDFLAAETMHEDCKVPSPLWGEGQGEGEPLQKQHAALTLALSQRERGQLFATLQSSWETMPAETTTTAKFLLHPVALGNVGQTTPQKVLASAPLNIVILAGPEGSFTDQEVDLALRDGFVPLDLGKRILRTETACIAAAAIFLIAGEPRM